MNENIETKVEKLRPFTRFLMTIGELPTSYLMSMSYYEQVLWFTKYLQEKVIPAVNNNAEVIEEIQNFLKNLDLQDEVNNKLDEMAESGELEEIISQYLNSTAIFGFDNVELMKQATNLINGSYAKTLGYYSKNDGGESLYKIENIEKNDSILLNNGLYANIIGKNLNSKQYGTIKDNIILNTEKINLMINSIKGSINDIGFINNSNTNKDTILMSINYNVLNNGGVK